MAAIRLEFLTLTGFISCIGGVVASATLKAVRTMRQQVRSSSGLLLAHHSACPTFGCLHVLARS